MHSLSTIDDKSTAIIVGWKAVFVDTVYRDYGCTTVQRRWSQGQHYRLWLLVRRSCGNPSNCRT